MRIYQYCVQSSYPEAQIRISGTIFIPTSIISLHRSHTIFIPRCRITNFVKNLHFHVRNYHLCVQSSLPHAVQSSYQYTQLPISCTIVITKCAITNCVYNLHIYMRNYQNNYHTQMRNYHIRVNRQTHNYIVYIPSSYLHAQLPISSTIFIPKNSK